MSEIVSEVKDMMSAVAQWQSLLRPHHMDENHLFEIGEGPAIRIVKGERDCIASLRFKVKSLDEAKKFLSQKGFLGEARESTITVNPAEFWDILFEFSE